MQTATHAGAETREAVTVPTFTPLAQEQRTHVDTDTAAYWLSRKPQTMRIWALTGHPIRPLRVNGRLAWPVGEIRKLLCVS